MYLFHILTAETQNFLLRSICIHGLGSDKVIAMLVNSCMPIGAYIPSTTLDPSNKNPDEPTNVEDIFTSDPATYVYHLGKIAGTVLS